MSTSRIERHNWTIRTHCTPAMAAGIARKPWEMADLLKAAQVAA